MASERRPARPSPGGKGTVYGARQVPGVPRKVRQALAKAEPVRRRRWMTKSAVIAAALVGAAGWYHYLTRPPIVGQAPAPARPPASRDASTGGSPAASPAPASLARSSDETAQPLPATFSAKELEDWLQSHPEGAQAFDRYAQNRAVTWSGVVESTSRADHLLGIEFTDSEGMRILAWCLSDAELPPSSSVTIRGKVARRRSKGFIVDRCRMP